MLKYFTEKEVAGLNVEFVQTLEKAREISGVPFVITSGYRVPRHNEAIGGAKDSAHTRGLAVDLRSRSSASHFAIVRGAILAGITRIGVYHDQEGKPSHCHLDIDDQLPQNVLWIGRSK